MSESVYKVIELVGTSPDSWELATKARLGKLRFDRPLEVWVKQALSRPRVGLVELSAKIAVIAGELDGDEFHGDPADRLIVATAIQHGAELVSKDRRIRAFAGVRSVW